MWAESRNASLEARMNSVRTLSVVGILLSVAFFPMVAQTVPATDAKNHLGEKRAVRGQVASKYVATKSQGTPIFIDLDKP